MSREAFEKWMTAEADEHQREALLARDKDGDYKYLSTAYAWDVWQAAQQESWTPYKEGDAVEDGKYLVTCIGYPYAVADFYRDGAFTLEGDGATVTAYRKWPEPYGGE